MSARKRILVVTNPELEPKILLGLPLVQSEHTDIIHAESGSEALIAFELATKRGETFDMFVVQLEAPYGHTHYDVLNGKSDEHPNLNSLSRMGLNLLRVIRERLDGTLPHTHVLTGKCKSDFTVGNSARAPLFRDFPWIQGEVWAHAMPQDSLALEHIICKQLGIPSSVSGPLYDDLEREGISTIFPPPSS
jgi:hypothetical protein